MRTVGYIKSKRSDVASHHPLSSDKPCGAILNERQQGKSNNKSKWRWQWAPSITWWRYEWNVRPTRHPHLPLDKEATAALRWRSWWHNWSLLGGENLGPTFRWLLSREMGPSLRLILRYSSWEDSLVRQGRNGCDLCAMPQLDDYPLCILNRIYI